ncbi:MAG: hypothetical protein WCC87_21400 [Candidatus Korobacteraceae bacterium]
MKRWLISTLFVGLAVSVCLGLGPRPVAVSSQAMTQSSAKQSTTNSHEVAGLFIIELTKSIDSKKLKPGEEVDAKLLSDVHASDNITFPRGTKVVGHVTQSKARSKGDPESALAISFDQISRAGGDTAIRSVIQAVGPNPDAGVDTGGGVGYGDLKAATAAPPAPSSSPRSVPLLTEESTGVLGIKNLELGSDGTLTSTNKEIKLDSGTRILLKASTQ